MCEFLTSVRRDLPLKFLSGKPHDFPETLHTRREICSFPFKLVTCEMLFEVYLTRDRDETRSNHGYYLLCRATMRKAFAVNTMVETGDKVST